jgi:hypothetical protein
MICVNANAMRFAVMSAKHKAVKEQICEQSRIFSTVVEDRMTTDHKIRVVDSFLTGALCRSEYHELIEGPDEVTQHQDGDDDPEHN